MKKILCFLFVFFIASCNVSNVYSTVLSSNEVSGDICSVDSTSFNTSSSLIDSDLVDSVDFKIILPNDRQNSFVSRLITGVTYEINVFSSGLFHTDEIVVNCNTDKMSIMQRNDHLPDGIMKETSFYFFVTESMENLNIAVSYRDFTVEKTISVLVNDFQYVVLSAGTCWWKSKESIVLFSDYGTYFDSDIIPNNRPKNVGPSFFDNNNLIIAHRYISPRILSIYVSNLFVFEQFIYVQTEALIDVNEYNDDVQDYYFCISIPKTTKNIATVNAYFVEELFNV